MHKLGINFDEISDDIDVAIKVMQDNGVKFGELRTVQGKNFVFWSDAEVEAFKLKIAASGIRVIAAATPLFKWYINHDDPEVVHDSFGFNPRLSLEEKNQTIKRAIEIAAKLEIPRLRIFSGLGVSDNVVRDFAETELLATALTLAKENGIELYLENEPVCIAHTQDQIKAVFKANVQDNFKYWLDIANLTELGEPIDDMFLETISSRVGYIHVKDYIHVNGDKVYVPAGLGEINFPDILSRIAKHSSPTSLIITVETHATKDKVESSVKSLEGTKRALEEAGMHYE